MRGRLLEVPGAGDGLILGEDGNRYGFAETEWKAATRPLSGIDVDFVAGAGTAREVYLLPAARQPDPPGQAVDGATDNSSLLGVIAVGCLVLGFVFPVLPTIAALVVGLIGADSAKRHGNRQGLVLSRIGWIGAALVLAIGALLLAFALQFLLHLMQQVFGPMLGTAITA